MGHKEFSVRFPGAQVPAIIPQTLHPGGGTMGHRIRSAETTRLSQPWPGRAVRILDDDCVRPGRRGGILAIWQFMGTDSLWRTAATCVVIAAGTLAFSWINGLFDCGRDS
jgi:hypothetical protein